MATRLYLPSSGTAPIVDLALAGAWNTTGDLIRLPMYPTPSGTALTTRTLTWANTSSAAWVWWQFQSPPIAKPVTLTGQSQFVIGKCAETTTNGDTVLMFQDWLSSSTGDNKGLLYSMYVGGTEYALMASAGTRYRGPMTTNRLSAVAGDRIILEVGVYGTTPAVENIQMRIGDPVGTADFAFTEDLTTDLLPFLEISTDIDFGEVYYDFSYISSTSGGTTANVLPVQSASSVALTVAAGQIIPIKSRIKSSPATVVGLLP